ncbi:MAG: hypothetical protein EPO13_07760 [Actinomycetota bacterium]|nr:MAG: hypothetical protein EPO13_07760 [Actinomycetota bacterium]
MQLPDDVTAAELDKDTRAHLLSLSRDRAELVARLLVMAGRLIDEDPEGAYQYAAAAQQLAARIAVVREAAGVTAYRAGHYAEAIAALRAARRMSGSDDLIAILADCERGLGRPERALALMADPAVARLDRAGRIETLIVAAGARRDLGQDDAAVLALQVPELRSNARAGWVARLRFAYADALAAVGRHDEARVWFERAAQADVDGETDAQERLDFYDGVEFFEE